VSLLEHLDLQCLDLWRQFVAIQVHQDFLEKLKCVFEFMGITQVEYVNQAKKYGKSHGDALQVAKQFHPLNDHSNILWIVLFVSTFWANHINPQGGLCNLSFSFFTVDVLMVKKYEMKYEINCKDNKTNTES